MIDRLIYKVREKIELGRPSAASKYVYWLIKALEENNMKKHR